MLPLCMRRISYILIFVAVIVFISSKNTCAFTKGEQNCTKCHSLNSEQAKKILDEIIPNLKILNVQNGPIDGLWEIGFDLNGKKNILYLDYSLKKVIAGRIVELSTKTDFTQESVLKLNKVDLSLVPYENAVLLGDKEAKHKVVVFDDPD